MIKFLIPILTFLMISCEQPVVAPESSNESSTGSSVQSNLSSNGTSMSSDKSSTTSGNSSQGDNETSSDSQGGTGGDLESFTEFPDENSYETTSGLDEPWYPHAGYVSTARKTGNDEIDNEPTFKYTDDKPWCDVSKKSPLPNDTMILNWKNLLPDESDIKEWKSYEDFNWNYVTFVDSLLQNESVTMTFDVPEDGLYQFKMPYISVRGNWNALLDFTYSIDGVPQKRFDNIIGASSQENLMAGEMDGTINICDSCYVWGLQWGQSYVEKGSHTLTFSTESGFLSFANPILRYLSKEDACEDNYRLVWNDEFNGTELDTTKWTAMLGEGSLTVDGVFPPGYGSGRWGNGEHQVYTDEPENLRVEDGNLVIEAHYNPFHPFIGSEAYFSENATPMHYMVPDCTGCYYTSARIISTQKAYWKYARVATRMKLPKGRGTWPAFWLLSENNDWPRTGEVDIMEYNGGDPRKWHTTVHYGYDQYNKPTDGAYPIWEEHINNEYHNVVYEWDQYDMRLWLNDSLIFSESTYPTTYIPKEDKEITWPWDNHYHILINMAIGGLFTNNQTPMSDKADADFDPEQFRDLNFLVDYVRVYQKK
ncbi:MAG: family 16 glycosylhydrolase [Reichenbachiella sp.]